MKKVITLLLFVIITSLIIAQETKLTNQDVLPWKSEIDVGYGRGTIIAIADGFSETLGDVFGSIITAGYSRSSSDSKSTGLIEIKYKYFVSKKISLAFRGGYQKINHTDTYIFNNNANNKSITKWYRQFINGMVDFNFYYINKEFFGLYSGLGLGVCFAKSRISSDSDGKAVQPDDYKESNDTYFAFQITGIGARFGKRFGGFVEAGLGYSGIINFGIYGKF